MILLIWLLTSIFMGCLTIYYLYDFLKNREGKHSLYWKMTSISLSLFLTIFGFFGYYNLRKIEGNNIPSSILVYFGAAIFVLFIVRRAYLMVDSLKKDGEKYHDLALKLEYETRLKTKELEKNVKELEDSRSAMINILEDISNQKNDLEKSKNVVEDLNNKLASSNTELLQLDNQKDQFTSIAAHELKTPIASIHGFVQLLQNKNIFSDEDKRNKYLQIIEQDTNRLSKLVTDILDISRIDLGTLRFYFDNVSVSEMVDSVKKEINPLIANKGIMAEYILSEDIPSTFFSDKDRIIQVLINLETNAVHYTEAGGSIIVKVNKKDDSLIFSIEDTGMGIPDDVKDKLFHRFYQVDNWLTRKIGGSGLGLSISKGIVEALGGKIWFESKVGKGTIFYFTIPVNAKHAQNVNADEGVTLKI